MDQQINSPARLGVLADWVDSTGAHIWVQAFFWKVRVRVRFFLEHLNAYFLAIFSEVDTNNFAEKCQRDDH